MSFCRLFAGLNGRKVTPKGNSVMSKKMAITPPLIEISYQKRQSPAAFG
jgi:hypothetical protein